MVALASEKPSGEEELLAVSGVGPRLVTRYGEKLLAIIANVGAG